MRPAVAHHDVFGSTSSKLFPNDFASANEVERMAREADEKKGKAEQDAADLEIFRTNYPVLERRKKDLETMLENIEGEKTQLEQQNKTLEAQLSRAASERAGLQLDLARLSEHSKNLQTQVNSLRTPLDPSNDLDPSFHEHDVHILMSDWPHMALDFGAGNATSAHGWTWDPNNGWQILRLRKADPNDRRSAWTVSKSERYLGNWNTDTEAGTYNGRAVDEEPIKAQEWWIGHNRGPRGGYILTNRRSGKCLQMQSPSSTDNGHNIFVGPPQRDNVGQIWQIILKQ